MHRLALLAVLLMVVAPLISRALLVAPAVPVPLMAAGAQPPAAAGMGGATHASAHHAQHMQHHDGTTMDMPPSPAHGDPAMAGHAEHGALCDYCVFAARLLPWLAVAALLLPLLRAPPPAATSAPVAPAASQWPAHAPRGPPLPA